MLCANPLAFKRREKMKGLLVVNSFLKNAKFGQLYDFLSAAFTEQNVLLEVRSSDELFLPVGKKLNREWDFVLFWDKDLRLARAFEESGMRVFNSSRAIELCDDKALTAECLQRSGLAIPKTLIAPKTYANIGYSNSRFLLRAEEFLSYPMVLKQRFGSFGAQVYLAENRKQAEEILERCAGNEILLQEFIAESSGRDLRINVVGNEVKGVMLRYNNSDFRSNITNGGKMEIYFPDRSYLFAAVAAARAVGADFAGVDVLFGKEGPAICEVNASPHFKSTLEATGVNLAKELSSYVLSEIQKKPGNGLCTDG